MSETVIAVLLTRGGSSSLAETVASLRLQSRPVDSLVAVNIGDAGSGQHVRAITDDIPILNLSDEREISSAIIELVHEEIQDQQIQGPMWIWFITDGSILKHDALANTVMAVEKSQSVRVAGAKQNSAHDTLLDVGLTTSHWANPVTLIDDGESDQGQHDNRSDVLGVSLSGMFVAQQTWEQLRGFDPNLPAGYQSLDFCWRVRASGDRVIVVPEAVVYHRDDGMEVDHHTKLGIKSIQVPLYEDGGLGTHPSQMSLKQIRDQRYSEAYLRLKNASVFTFPFLYFGLILNTPLRFLGSLILKNLGAGWNQLQGAMAVVLRPGKIFRARASVKEIRCVSRSVIKSLQATNQDMWNYRRDYSPAVMTVEKNTGEEHPTGEATNDVPHDVLPQARANFGLPLVVVVSFILSLGNTVNFYGSSAIGGGASLPVSKNLFDLWHNATGWWVDAGSGFAAYAHPFSSVLGVFGLLGMGNANIAIVIFFMFSGPIAAVGMWFLGGALTRRYFIRCCASILWAIAPVHDTIIAQGRLNSLVVFVLAPWVALALLRAVGGSRKDLYSDGSDKDNNRAINGSDGRISWTAAAAGGLGLAVMTACVPSLLPIAVIGIVVAAVVLRRRGVSLWWAAIPSLALSLPYLWSSRRQPRAIFADPGVPVSVSPVPLWQQILGFADHFKPSGGVVGLEFLSEKLPGVPWALAVAVFTTVPIVILAVAAVVFYGRRAGFVRVLWGGIVVFLIASSACPLIVTAVDRNAVVTLWSGNFVIIIYLLLMCAAIIGADAMGYRKNVKEYEQGSHRRIFFIPVSLMLTSFIAGGAVFFVQQFAAPASFSGQDASVPQKNPVLEENSPANTADADSRPEKVSDVIPTTGTDWLGSTRWAQGVNDSAVPVTAADFGNSELRTKTLVINAVEDRPLAAALVRGSGDTLDAAHPIVTASVIRKENNTVSLDYDTVDSMTRNTVAALVSGNGASVVNQLRDLGVGFVVLRHQSDTAQSMVQAVKATPGLDSVGLTSYGWLWQVKGLESARKGENSEDAGQRKELTAHIRFVDKEGSTVGAVPAVKGGAHAEVTIPENAVKIVMAERFSPLWKASFENQALSAGDHQDGLQEFVLNRHGKGRLAIGIEKSYDWFIKSIISAVFIITLLLAVPVRTKVRGGNREPSVFSEKIVGGGN